MATHRLNHIAAGLALVSLLQGCQTTPSASVPGGKSVEISSTAKLAVRYADLQRQGSPEKITEEFSRDVLVLNAEYLFDHSVTHHNLRLYSDLPFDAGKGRKILKETEKRLKASPIYDPTQPHLGFVCNAPWKSEYFLQGKDKYGGMNYWSIAPRVFFARASIADDVVLSPRNRPIADPRTFTYYVTHEFSHSMIGFALGKDGFHDLPKWLSEGYADYVALGPKFTLEQARSAYKNRDPRVNGTLAEDYMRYDIMTAYYLEIKSRDVKDLLQHPPSEQEAELQVFGQE